MRAAAQLLAFNRAVELFQNKQISQALTFFKRSRANNVDPQLHAETFYWEGEILYNKRDYPGAAAAYAKFSTTPGSYLSELHNDADYARGYAHYKSEKYTDALSAFRSYLGPTPTTIRPACATPNSGRQTASTRSSPLTKPRSTTTACWRGRQASRLRVVPTGHVRQAR